jgi:hypothetical protein
MANVVTLDGVIVNLWHFDAQLRVRLAHRAADGERAYFNLVFPADRPVLIKETDATGRAQARQVRITVADPGKLRKYRVVAVTGHLVHRNHPVSLAEFLQRARAPQGVTLSDADRATLDALADKVGREHRSQTEVCVEELLFL